MKSAFFFLPDISGFTSFVTSTEQVHSRHLIGELLEQVIDANLLSLEVQEVEGDAVFFLREGASPTRQEVLAQARAMFLSFHTHLRVIERDNVCQCGACRTVSNLTLKFVAHYGEMDRVRVAGHSTVSGADVILAHRLLKNSIPDREYILLTKTLFTGEEEPEHTPFSAVWRETSENVEHFPPQVIAWLPLSPWLKDLPPVQDLPAFTPSGSEQILRKHIRAPLLLVHALLTDPEKKKEFVPGLRESRSELPINRVQSSHTCVFDDFEIRFVTRENRKEGDAIVYKESAEASFGFSSVYDYRLTGTEDGTELIVRILPGTGSSNLNEGWWGRFRLLGKRVIARYSARLNLRRFAAYCEKAAGSGVMEAGSVDKEA